MILWKTLKKTKANISLFEMCNVPQQKEKLLKALEVPEEELPTDNQPKEEIGEASVGGKSKYKTPAFLPNFEIFDYNVHNCLVDSGESVNVMPFSACKKINGQPKPSTWQVLQLDRTTVKLIWEMEESSPYIFEYCNQIDRMKENICVIFYTTRD